MLLSIYLLYRWIKNSQYEREKRQGTIIMRGFIFILISGSLVDILLPMIIANIIVETGTEPYKLEFEITESIFMDETEYIIKKLTRMKALGVKISKDDAIISSLILLAKKLGCKVIAEGVEKEDQLNYLKQTECDDI